MVNVQSLHIQTAISFLKLQLLKLSTEPRDEGHNSNGVLGSEACVLWVRGTRPCYNAGTDGFRGHRPASNNYRMVDTLRLNQT